MYCLDTNIVIYYQNNSNQKVTQKLLTKNDDELCITQITRSELFYGAYKSQQIQQNLVTAKDFCNSIQVINPTFKSDEIFGLIKANLRRQGKIVADFDLMIASICLANDLILVTANTKHFENIEGLKVEDWSV